MTDPLVVTIDNKEPVEAGVFARTLSALSADYRRATGHQLIVQRIATGSLIVWLVTEGLKRIGEIDDLAEFARNLRSLWQATVEGRLRPKSSRRVGSSTIGELVELSVKARAKIRVSKREADGTEVTVEITPEVAHNVRASFTKAPKPSAARSAQKVRRAEIELESYVKSVLDAERASGTSLQGPDGRLDLIQVLLEVIRELPEGQEILKRVKNRLRALGYDHEGILGP